MDATNFYYKQIGVGRILKTGIRFLWTESKYAAIGDTHIINSAELTNKDI